MRSRQGGFTLVEVMIAVGILALISSSMALAFPKMLSSYRMKQAVTQFSGTIREAQVRAVQEGKPWRIRVQDDGSGIALQYATSSATDPEDCGLAGWETRSVETFHETIAVQTWVMNRPCVAYGSSGRAEWPTPVIVPNPHTTDPYYGGGPATIRLVDGVSVSAADFPSTPLTDERMVSWYRGTPRVTVDMGESRYLPTMCIGLYSHRGSNYRYPQNIRVEATAMVDSSSGTPLPPSTAGAWSLLYNGAGPAEPATGVKDRQCFSVTVNGSYRFFRITFTPVGNYTILDEIELADVSFRLAGPDRTNRLVLTPVTGRVRVEQVTP